MRKGGGHRFCVGWERWLPLAVAAAASITHTVRDVRKGVMTLREWMDGYLPPKVLAVIDWPRYRLFGMCWAENCPVIGRANILHTPRQLWRCENTPMAIVLNEDHYAEMVGEPVVPVSHAEPA
jgi:hypothetical protein